MFDRALEPLGRLEELALQLSFLVGLVVQGFGREMQRPMKVELSMEKLGIGVVLHLIGIEMGDIVSAAVTASPGVVCTVAEVVGRRVAGEHLRYMLAQTANLRVVALRMAVAVAVGDTAMAAAGAGMNFGMGMATAQPVVLGQIGWNSAALIAYIVARGKRAVAIVSHKMVLDIAMTAAAAAAVVGAVASN